MLFGHLRQLWADDSPRVMVDLGCHSGHSYRRNISDATLWLDHFHHAGGSVLGVDAIEDYANDLQHRFDHLEPYSSMQIEKLTRAVAIGAADGQEVLLGTDLLGGCTGTWLMDWDMFERRINLDHYCRITRQRLGLGAADLVARRQATLPTPPPPRIRTDAQGRFHLQSMRTDSLWEQALGGRHIDFLKIDIDMSWKRVGMERLLRQRGASLIVLEVDVSWPLDTTWGVTDMDQLCWLATKLGYTPLLKVPCTAKRRAANALEPGLATWYHPLLPAGVRTCVPFGWRVPWATWGIQDFLLVDTTRHPRLDAQLHELGRADCVPPRFGRALSLAELRARAPVAATRGWVAKARPGFCAVTSADEPSDCLRGSKGVLGLLPQEVETETSAARACLARCAACSQCRFVSLSRKLADCSWYATCDFARLRRDVKHFISGPALPRNVSKSSTTRKRLAALGIEAMLSRDGEEG